MDRLKGRGVQFFQIAQKHNSYNFDALQVNDLTKEKTTYLREIPAEITGNQPIQFNIISKNYYRDIKAVAEIELESKIGNDQLKWIANLLRNDLFRNPKRLFIMYYLKNDKKRDLAWATTHFVESELTVTINDFGI